jgi:hypothetical protein
MVPHSTIKYWNRLKRLARAKFFRVFVRSVSDGEKSFTTLTLFGFQILSTQVKFEEFGPVQRNNLQK